MARARGKTPGNYDVGWGRPPKHTKFKPGQSGNPKGRPKNRKRLTDLFIEALNQPLDVRIRGKECRMSAREAVVRRIVVAAVNGDFKAASFLLAKEPEIERAYEQRSVTKENLKDMSAEELSALYFRVVRGEE